MSDSHTTFKMGLEIWTLMNLWKWWLVNIGVYSLTELMFGCQWQPHDFECIAWLCQDSRMTPIWNWNMQLLSHETAVWAINEVKLHFSLQCSAAENTAMPIPTSTINSTCESFQMRHSMTFHLKGHHNQTVVSVVTYRRGVDLLQWISPILVSFLSHLSSKHLFFTTKKLFW